MQFKLNGTKAILTPASKEVEAMYLARPGKYMPVDAAPAAPPADKPLDKMNKAELLAKAAELTLTVPDKATNAEIIALIKSKEGTGNDSGQ